MMRRRRLLQTALLGLFRAAKARPASALMGLAAVQSGVVAAPGRVAAEILPPTFTPPASITLGVGQTFDLAPFARHEGATSITFTIVPESAAEVSLASNGVLTGLAQGSVVVTVMVDDGRD
jgi:hypothetical protein